MANIAFFTGIVLLVMAVRFHMLTQANEKTKIQKQWFDRLFTGSRSPKENLTEQGLKYRKASNNYAIAGFLMLGLYVLLKSIA